jgi:hypothetical protein
VTEPYRDRMLALARECLALSRKMSDCRIDLIVAGREPLAIASLRIASVVMAEAAIELGIPIAEAYRVENAPGSPVIDDLAPVDPEEPRAEIVPHSQPQAAQEADDGN